MYKEKHSVYRARYYHGDYQMTMGWGRDEAFREEGSGV